MVVSKLEQSRLNELWNSKTKDYHAKYSIYCSILCPILCTVIYYILTYNNIILYGTC